VKNKYLVIIALFIFPLLGIAQDEKKEQSDNEILVPNELVLEEVTTSNTIDPLRPARAAFYSAVLPGLGQAYNKKYWKIPIVYAALGTGIYFYLDNDKELTRYRDVYKRRLAGFTDDEFPNISNDALIRAQKTLRRNKEISLLVTIGIYALNIIDANVDAHLLQFNVDDNLAIKPHFQMNEIDASTNLGLTLGFKF
jgi:hypothetical protein